MRPGSEAAPESYGPVEDGGARVDVAPRTLAPPELGAHDAGLCRDAMTGQLARVACDGMHILVAHPIVAPPRRTVPPEPTRRVLDAVAALMQRQPALQLLRIEAYSSHDVGQGAEHVRREIERSQARADAVFRYLWRVKGISPERLDPVGYGFQRAFKGARQRWPIVLHVAQRAAR